MRRRQFIAAIVVAICVLAPVVEAFDGWDHTLQDGNDTEGDVVVVALCVGIAFSIATSIVVHSPALVSTHAPLCSPIPTPSHSSPRRLAAVTAVGGPAPPLRV